MSAECNTSVVSKFSPHFSNRFKTR